MSLKNKKGFTLVEIIVAISILAILAVVFLPIMTMSYSHIVKTGKKSQRLYEAQNVMEISIIDENVFKAAEIPIKQEGKDPIWVIKGGLVEADQLQTFLPWVAAMSLEPDSIVEGYESDVKIIAKGVNTHFKAGSQVTITNDSGYSNNTVDKSRKSDTECEITLPIDGRRLKNSGNQYIITIETDGEIVKSKLNIRLPQFIRAQSGIINVSRDARKDGEKSLEDTGEIRGLFWTGNRFFVLGKNRADDKGIIYILEDGKDWKEHIISNSKALNALVYDGNRFVAVGDKGNILYSSDGVKWTKVADANMPDIEADTDIKSVTWGSFTDINGITKELFVAAGTNGTILTSSKGDTWNKVAIDKIPSEDKDLNSVLWGVVVLDEIPKEVIVAVGQEGIMIFTEDGENWKTLLPENAGDTMTENLNSLIWQDNKFLAIGDNTSVITIEKHPTWKKLNIINNFDGKNFYDICWGPINDTEDGYIIVGDRRTATKGIIITLTDEGIQEKKETNNTFYKIASRK